MENKVIIDEVDVSGCEFCSATGQCKIQQVFQRNEIVGIIEKPYGVHLECNLCDKDCYYKQLKRKEQECEKLKWLLETKCQSEWEKENAELKAENEKLKTDIGIFKGIIDSDKEENERLKEELRTEKIYSSQIEELEESLQHAKAENKELSESIKRLKNMAKAAALGREKYKQALQEIREYCEEQNLKADYTACEIIDKINSVIGTE